MRNKQVKEFKVNWAESKIPDERNANAEELKRAVAVKLTSSQRQQMNQLNELDGFPTPPPVIQDEVDQFYSRIQVAKLKWQMLKGFDL